MPTDIKALLKKKGWTGRELGILELTNMAEMYDQHCRGIQEPKEIIDRAAITAAVHNLDRANGPTYNGYISIHEWLAVQAPTANAYSQQLQLGLATILQYILSASATEKAYEYVEKLPAIMTRKEYEEKKAEGIHRQLYDENGEPITWNVYSAVEHVIAYYAELLVKEPKRANPFKAIKKKYQKELVKSSRVRSMWPRVMGEGYYTLEDGSRSDEMTDEEWQEAITTPKMKEALRALREEHGDLTAQIAREQMLTKRLMTRGAALFSGATEEEADKIQQVMDYREGYAMPATWHYYEEAPEDLSKWDVIEAGLYEFFLDWSTEETMEATLEEFYAEFKEAADLALKEMDKKHDMGAAQIPLKEWLTNTIPLPDLYEMDFFGFRAFIEYETSLWDGNRRALFNGIAIYEPCDFKKEEGHSPDSLQDERGYYKPPTITDTLTVIQLSDFFQESEEYAQAVENVETARANILDSYYFLMAHNRALDMIAEYFEVPRLEVFKFDLEGFATRIEAVTGMIFNLYTSIKGRDYEDKELKEKKLEVLRDIFFPINYKALKIPEEAEQAVLSAFNGFKAFKDTSFIAETMCYRPEGMGTDDGLEEGGEADE